MEIGEISYKNRKIYLSANQTEKQAVELPLSDKILQKVRVVMILTGKPDIISERFIFKEKPLIIDSHFSFITHKYKIEPKILGHIQPTFIERAQN